ncbi:MAG TPA: STAS-like domain-containing protein [Blastocatellia bacterium]
MADEIVVRVFDVVGGPLAVSTDDGQAVHEKIAPLLRSGKRVVVSFAKIETLISAFLNAAIGQLYGEFSEQVIRDLFSVRDMSQIDLALLKRVVDNAKSYFANRDNFDEAWKQEVGQQEDADEE